MKRFELFLGLITAAFVFPIEWRRMSPGERAVVWGYVIAEAIAIAKKLDKASKDYEDKES